jgi:hypothetical protein
MRARGAFPAGNRPLESSVHFLLLPDEKRAVDFSVPDQPVPMQQRWQSPLAELVKTDCGEVALLVSAEDQAKNFLGQPTVEQAQLRSVCDVLEVVVKYRDISHTSLNRLTRNRNECARALTRLRYLSPAALPAAKGEAEEVLDFPRFVARQRDSSAAVELKTQVTERSSLLERAVIVLWPSAQGQIFSVT